MPVIAARLVTGIIGGLRAGPCAGLAALALLLGSESLQNAVAVGDTRTISLHHIHTGEDITITYKRDGRYDEDALKKINWVLRDWRRNEEIRMDPRLIDAVWEVNREVGGKEAIQIICGYRSPQTNSMLRRRSRGVARFSQHTLGKAMDLYIPGVSLEAQRAAGLRLQRGGLGFYPSSGSPFVHIDVGGVRHWPRMTHDQLARVFPNGRTVHVPSDGHPLSGYALALADIEKRGASPSQTSLDSARSAGIDVSSRPKRNLLAASFSGGKDEEEDRETAASSATKRTPANLARTGGAIAASADKTEARGRAATAENAKPARPATFALASAPVPPIRPVRPAEAATPAVASLSANDIIAMRGYWEGLPNDEPAAAPSKPQERIRTASAGPAPVSRERPAGDERGTAPETTGSIAPWPMRPGDANDRVHPELALAYAAQDAPSASRRFTRAAPMGSSIERMPVAASLEEPATTVEENSVTVVKKTFARLPSGKEPAAMAPPTSSPKASMMVGTRFDDPWLRAMMLAPSLQMSMTATLLGTPDFSELRPLMHKPTTTVMMTFSDDPYPGMTVERFSGGAVVFLATVTFARRTASLQ